jgi:hypothetical protein
MVARVQRVNGLIHRDILVGVFCLWVSLTILGVVGLNNIGQGVISSVSLKIGAAPGIALMVSIISSPLFVPWLAVFVLAYLLIPRSPLFGNGGSVPLSGLSSVL